MRALARYLGVIPCWLLTTNASCARPREAAIMTYLTVQEERSQSATLRRFHPTISLIYKHIYMYILFIYKLIVFHVFKCIKYMPRYLQNRFLTVRVCWCLHENLYTSILIFCSFCWATSLNNTGRCTARTDHGARERKSHVSTDLIDWARENSSKQFKRKYSYTDIFYMGIIGCVNMNYCRAWKEPRAIGNKLELSMSFSPTMSSKWVGFSDQIAITLHFFSSRKKQLDETSLYENPIKQKLFVDRF